MEEKRLPQSWPSSTASVPPPVSTVTQHAGPPSSSPLTRSDTAFHGQTPLPPLLPAKRPYEEEPWPSSAAVSQQLPPPPAHAQTVQTSEAHNRLGPLRSAPPPANSHPTPTNLYSTEAQRHDAPSSSVRRRVPYPPATDAQNRYQKETFNEVPIGYASHTQSASNAPPHVHGHPSAPPPVSAAGSSVPPPGSAAVSSAAARRLSVNRVAVSAAATANAAAVTAASSSPTEAFVLAAEMGARAQSAVDSATNNGRFETYELGKTIVASSKLYANQRRSNRMLPGGSDSTTAACYMIGGTPDSVLSPLLSRVNPCDPREERCKAVERVLKDKTRGAICALNGENPREARADNLAAVRICEVVADVLVAYCSRRMVESRQELFAQVKKQDEVIKELRQELNREKKRRIEQESECWCKGQADARQMIAPDVQAFEQDKLVRQRVFTSSGGHRSIDSDGALSEAPVEKQDPQ